MLLSVLLPLIIIVLAYLYVRVRWHFQGADFLAKGQFDEAIVIFTRIRRYYPLDTLSLQSRGTAYRYKGDLSSALADYTRSIEMGGRKNGLLYLNRAYLFLYWERFADARNDYELALLSNPDLPQAHVGLIYVHLHSKEYEQVINSSDAMLNQWQVLADKRQKYGAYISNRSPEALAQFEVIYQAVWIAKARALAHLGRVDEAREVLHMLQTKYPTNIAFIYSDGAELEFFIGDYATALAYFERVLMNTDKLPQQPISVHGYPSVFYAQAGYAVTLFVTGDIEQAQAQWRDLQTKAPLLTSAERVGKEFFWSEAMTAKAKELEASFM
ncbi:MAG: tetratricopeptide repeat protein [bacterium]|nr:tetratricopeptide repeat protein [bacterium]